jgi:hypothetical protein
MKIVVGTMITAIDSIAIRFAARHSIRQFHAYSRQRIKGSVNHTVQEDELGSVLQNVPKISGLGPFSEGEHEFSFLEILTLS